MREIKFRAWDKEQKEMFTPLILNWVPSGIPIRSPIQLWHQRSQVSDDGFWVEEFELMQFTGLKDKNGKEIYEGDIVKLKMILKPEMITDYGEGVIIFHDAHYFCRTKDDGDITMNWCDTIEVIGNIYENPELIKDKKK